MFRSEELASGGARPEAKAPERLKWAHHAEGLAGSDNMQQSCLRRIVDATGLE